MLRFILIVLLGCFSQLSHSQSTFYEATEEVMGAETINSTIGIAIEDVNNDLRDDIIMLDEGKILKTFLQNTLSKPFSYQEHYQTSAFGEWAIMVGDLNNDGTPEVIASGNENGSEILFLNNNSYLTTQITTPIFSQNTNLVDFNNDGFLDFFVCNDIGENRTYINDGSGKLIYQKIIDFKTSEEDDMSGNYSSIFTDIDGDGDLDLYIGKCRADASLPTDPRRINTLYINNGDGSYTERAADFGLANGSQSWSVDSGDVDNDGDLDILIANHDREHDLMINNGDGTFERFEGLPSESKSFAYQSFFADFDNNGWLDIFITEPSKSYILYNSEMCFSQYDLTQSGKKAFSGATGDLNGDGYLDMVLGFADSFQSPGDKSDVVLYNSGGLNNYLMITLTGNESNRDGVGSKIIIHYDENQIMREVTAGKSYGIHNSTKCHFGLGTHENIDSIVVSWPSGNRQVITENIVINSQLNITESSCALSNIRIPNHELCDGAGIVVRLDDAYDTYLWSDGSTADSLYSDMEGEYWVEVEKDGCRATSNYFKVNKVTNFSSDALIYPENSIGCNDDVVRLNAIPGYQYNWSDGSTRQSINVTDDDVYSVTITTNCGSYVSDDISISYVKSDDPDITQDTIQPGVQATISITGDDVQWYRKLNDELVIHHGSEYQTSAIFRDTSFFAGVTNSTEGQSAELLTPVPLNTSADNQFTKNDTLTFTVIAPINLHSISVRTQESGVREIELWKGNLKIATINKDFQQGVNDVIFNERLDGGVYYLTTNQEVNVASLGTLSPRFSYSNQFIGNDKIVDGHLNIGQSTLAEGYIPFFFNWNISYEFYECEERYEVSVIVDEDVATDEEAFRFDIFPNPNNGYFNIRELDGSEDHIEIYDNIGNLVASQNVKLDHRYSFDLKSGYYVLKVKRGQQIIARPLIIIH